MIDQQKPFFLALMRMTASYGSVNMILSDNATEYKAASKKSSNNGDDQFGGDQKKGRRKWH